jgi:type VI secretion system secreted protein Hcp
MADVSQLNIFAYLYLEPDKGPAFDGGAMDSIHKGEIQVITYKFGLTNTKKYGSTGDGDIKPDFSEGLSLTTVPSKASTSLFMAAARGDLFKRATICVRKHGVAVSGADYLQIQMTNLYITSYNHSAGDAAHPSETINFNYQTLDFYYAHQEQDGTLKSATARMWSQGTNAAGVTALPFKKGS